jgi:DNA polymerase-3 subunit epsilon
VGHHLDGIAGRLGVTVEGRHTSMGDARATAEIFLRLLPLLSSRGVVTLADAKAFCDKMLLLRWQTSRF